MTTPETARFEEFRRIANSDPSFGVGQAFVFALLAHGSAIETREAPALLQASRDSGTGPGGLLSRLMARRLEAAVRTGISPPLCGFVFAGYYRHQLLPLALGLRDRNACTPLGFIDLGEWDFNDPERIHPYLGIPLLPMGDSSLLSNFTNLEAVFAPDTAHRMLVHAPRSTRRIALMHGVIGRPEYTLSHEGGGTIFDHILLPGHPSLPEDFLEGVFPAEMIRHGSRSVTLVPSGYPKLDEMVRAFRSGDRGNPRKVVVHLSVEDHDSKKGMEALPSIIEELLSASPSIDVVFRPFPGQSSAFVDGLISRFGARGGFQISRSESYVGDYVDSAAIVTLKETTAEVASLASGIPIFCLIPERPPGPFPRGRICASGEEVLRRIRAQLESPWRERCRILTERDRNFSRVGESDDAVVELLDSFRGGSPRPEWRELRLGIHDGVDPLSAYADSLRRTASEPKSAVTEISAQVVASALERFPANAEILSLCAENLRRIAVRHLAIAATQRLASHHFHYVEMFVLVHVAAVAVQRCAPCDQDGTARSILLQTNEALASLRMLEQAESTVEGCVFPALEQAKRFLTSPREPSQVGLAALRLVPRRHPNHPCDLPKLADEIERFLIRENMPSKGADHATFVRTLRNFPAALESSPFPMTDFGNGGSSDDADEAQIGLLELLSIKPEEPSLWEAVESSLSAKPLTTKGLELFERILPHVFGQEERLTRLWSAAVRSESAEVLESIVDFLASLDGTSPELLLELSAIASEASGHRRGGKE